MPHRSYSISHAAASPRRQMHRRSHPSSQVSRKLDTSQNDSDSDWQQTTFCLWVPSSRSAGLQGRKSRCKKLAEVIRKYRVYRNEKRSPEHGHARRARVVTRRRRAAGFVPAGIARCTLRASPSTRRLPTRGSEGRSPGSLGRYREGGDCVHCALTAAVASAGVCTAGLIYT